MKIYLQPISSNLDIKFLNNLIGKLKMIFPKYHVEILDVLTLDSKLINKIRGQCISDKLLDWLSKNIKVKNDDRLVAIVDADAYTPGTNFIFGHAFLGGNYCAVYLHRLKTTDTNLFFERLLKEIVHELGHTMGLRHCENRFCVMNFSNSIVEVDFKKYKFCNNCLKKLEFKGIKVGNFGILWK